ncbi:MAG: transposase [Phormidesmis sp. RL_2_1]|nr:transposase [Phormidesmis sp. RL_2_1]
MAKPFLSIVVPMREGFSTHWFEELLKVQGDVEFILIHPPGVQPEPCEDRRMRQLVSPFRGEIIQRLSGLINATGQYVLTFNCDEYINPELPALTKRYFQQFPDSWMMRLSKQDFPYGDEAAFHQPWINLPEDLTAIPVCRKDDNNLRLYEKENRMMEVPIAPMHNKFDIACILRGRRDHFGPHAENFDKKVWINAMVQETLQDIIGGLTLTGPIKYLPFWCLDRLLGLSLQAKFYDNRKPDQVIGHKLPYPAQLRVEDNPPEYRRQGRFYIFAEIILLRLFPQYGYIWNLVIHQIREFPVRALLSLQRKFVSTPS